MFGAFPIGSIYLSVNSTSPASLFGGTWEKIKDKFLLSSGDTYTNGAIGGEATHTLTIEEMPSHVHTKYMSDGTETNEPLVARIPHFVWNKHGQAYIDTEASGGGQPYYPYYYGVYAWIRIN